MQKWDLKSCDGAMAIEEIKRFNSDRIGRIERFRVLNYQDVLNHYGKKYWLKIYAKLYDHCPEATILEIEGSIEEAGRLGAA